MNYTRVKDVERIIDRDRNTILRWEREGKIPHPRKDSRGWRFYTEKDVEIIRRFVRANANAPRAAGLSAYPMKLEQFKIS